MTQEDLVTTRQPLAIAQGVAEPVERSADHPRPGRTYSVVGDEQIHGRVFASDSAVSPMPRRKATPRGSSGAGRGVVVSAGQGRAAMRLGPIEIVLLVAIVIGLIFAVRTFAGRAGRR